MNWLVIASQIKAHIYHLDERGHLKLLAEFDNPLGRERNRALRYAKPGLNRAKMKNSSPHSMTGEKNPHDDVEEQFARQLSDYLRKQFLKNSFKKINIVAEPKLLGKIRPHVEKFLKDEVKWIAKDLEKVPKIKWPEILGYRRKPGEDVNVRTRR